MTRQVTDQLYIDLDYFTPEEYYVYTAEAAAAVSSAASVACDATVIAGGVVEEASGNLELVSTVSATVGVIKTSEVTLTVTATATAMISHIEGADLFAFSEAQLALEVSVIRDYNIASSAAFNIAVDGVRGIYVSAQADSISSIDIMGLRSRATEAAVNAAFSLTVDIDKTVTASADIQSLSTLAADTVRTRDLLVNVTSAFTPTLAVDVFRNSFAVLDVAAELTATADPLIKQGAAELFTESTQTALGGFILESNAALSSAFSIYVDKSAGSIRPIEFVDVDGDPSLILFTTQDQTVSGRANTGQRKYGTHSLLFVAQGQPNIVSTISTYTDFLDVPANSEFAIEFWVYVTADKLAATGPSIVWVGAAARDATNDIGSLDNWAVGYGDGTINNSSLITFSFWNRTTNSRQFIQGASGGDNLDFDVWKHIAVRRDSGGVIRVYENSEQLANATYTGALGSPSSGTKLHFGNTGFNSVRSGFTDTNSGIFIDEISYRIGNSTISGATQAITGLNDSQRVLLHLDNSLVDDVSGIEQVAAALVTTATLSVITTETQGAEANLSSEFSLTAQAQLTLGGNSVLSSQFAQQTSIDKLKIAASDLSSEFAQSTNATIIADIAAAFTAQADQNTVNYRTRDVSIATDAIATQLSAVAKTGAGLVTMEVAAVQTTDAAKITDVVSAIESTASVTVAAIKAVDGAADVSSTAELTTEANRLRSTLVEAAASSTATAELNIIHGGQASLDSSVAVLVETSGIISATAALASTSDFAVIGSRTRSTEVNAASETTVVALGIKAVGYAADLAAAAELSIPGERIRPAEITTESVASQLSIVVKTGQGLVTCEVQATLVADCSIIAENEITAILSTQLAAVAVKTAQSSADLTAVSNSSIEGTTNITLDAVLATEFTMTVTVNSTGSGAALVASSGVLAAIVGVVKPLAADLSALAFEVTLGERSRDVAADLTATVTFTAVIGGVFNNQANLQGFAAQVTVGKIIHITDTLTYTVPAERTTYLITAENTVWTIAAEDRLHLIKG